MSSTVDAAVGFSDHRPWIIPLLAAGILLAQVPLFHGYVTDDSYIYARFADNLATHGQLAFNPGEPVHAATSPLWAALGAVGALVGVGSYPMLHLLGVLFGAASCALLLKTVARFCESPVVLVSAALVIAVEPWLVRWSMSAMETALGIFLIAVLMDAALRPVPQVRWSRAAWAVGLLPLVRPEAILLLVLLGAHVLRTPMARRRAGVWVGALLPMAIWSAIAIPLYGHVLPATLQAKSTPLGFRPDRILLNVRVLVLLFGLSAAVPTLVWVSRLRLGRLWRAPVAAWAAPALWQWSLLLPLVYLARDVQVVSRYLELVLPVITVLAFVSARSWWESAWGRRSLWLQALLSIVFTVGWSAPSARAFGESWERSVGEIALWLRENSAPDALVAIYDIGLVGQRSNRRVLDLGGLVHPGINDLRNEVDDAVIQREGLFLRFGRPDYFVDRDPAPAVLDGARLGDVRLEAILTREVANLGLSRPGPIYYTLYRVLD